MGKEVTVEILIEIKDFPVGCEQIFIARSEHSGKQEILAYGEGENGKIIDVPMFTLVD